MRDKDPGSPPAQRASKPNHDAFLLQMFDFYIVPFVPQVLGDKATMTMMRLVLAAEQTSSIYY